MDSKTVYLFNHETLEYSGPYEAQESPLEEGVYIVPENSTEKEPPACQDDQRQVFLGGVWCIETIPQPDQSSIPTLDDVKASVWGLIKDERDRRKNGGFRAAGKWFHSDAGSKLQHLGNKDTARDQLAAGGTMADPLLDEETGRQIDWKTMDGSWLPLTCQRAFDVVRAGKASEFAHHTAAEIHQAAMESCADPAAYDFSGGWPEIFEG